MDLNVVYTNKWYTWSQNSVECGSYVPLILLPLQLQPSCYSLVCWLIRFCCRLDPGFFLGAQWSLLKTSLATLVKIWLGLI